jgi:hypothetical protein
MVVSKQKEVKDMVKKSEVDDLKKQIAELRNLIDSNKKNDKTDKAKDLEDTNDHIEISSDSYIKVMSVTPYLLTLTTEKYGKGKSFDFHTFGEVKRILYHNLCDIMESHPNLLREGYYVILNGDVVRKHGLDDLYAKILTKEKLEQILVGNQSDAANLFRACSDAQREFIIDMIHNKIIAGEIVDLNLLDRLSRIVDPSGNRSIAQESEHMKSLFAKK